ncbi:MAG: glycoside hydrolase family 19 protein [Rhizobiales bacterium]|nr:glycoside hydrolase family 19 protein [Hyphomicrobiales bacterium]
MVLTPALLRDAIGCGQDLAEQFAPHLSDACELHDIKGPVRVAAFLAQIAHESGALRHTRELWGPTPAQARYEGRKDLGNTHLGDGFLYRGRGLIQITGRANYAGTAQRLGIDLLASPELLEQPRWAALSAADWWAAHGCNALADAGDFTALTRRINGGTNGLEDRLQRWARAKEALAGAKPAAPAPQKPAQAMPEPANTPPRPDAEPYTQEPPQMPLAPIIGALLPSLIESIPKLGKLFGSGSAVAERNVAAATMAMEVVQQATGAINAQEALEKVKADPAVAAAAAKAVESRWLEIAEAGGGGIEGARKADAVATASGDLLHSPSFWIACLILPLVYLLVLSLIGLIGTATWSDDVRAGLAGSLISAVIGGLVGYYYGQTTSRNRTPAA